MGNVEYDYKFEKEWREEGELMGVDNLWREGKNSM